MNQDYTMRYKPHYCGMHNNIPSAQTTLICFKIRPTKGPIKSHQELL